MDQYINAGRWFSILYRRSQLFIVEACQKLNLTFSEYTLLMHIYEDEGAKQDELASRMYLDKAVVTRTVNLLQDKGFIYREQDTRDRRVKHIYLTEYGRQQYDFLHSILDGWIDYLVQGMDEADVQRLFGDFDRLVERACDANLVTLARKVTTEGAGHESR